SLSIAVGGVYGLAVMGLSADDLLEDISNLVTWVPGSKGLSVDNTGNVSANAAFDSTTVDASYLDDTVSAKVDAYASDGVYLEASTAVARVEVGQDMQLRVSLVSVGKREDVTSQTTFDVGNDNIARVELDEK